MSRTIVLMMLSVTVAGCSLVSAGASGPSGVTATLRLSNEAGRADTTFATGQDFYMGFKLTNGGPDTVRLFTQSEPPVRFEILRNDSVIASTVTAIMNVVITQGFEFAPGQSISGACEAPVEFRSTNPGDTVTSVTLPPGSYVAKAVYPSISGAKVGGVSLVGFTVTQ